MTVIREDTCDVDEKMRLGMKKGGWNKTRGWLMSLTWGVCMGAKENR